MKLSSRQQIQALLRFKSNHFLTTSFFIDTDKSRLSKKQISVSFKNLLHQGRTGLEALETDRGKKDSLSQDLEKISQFGTQVLPTFAAPGLALFSCAGENFWQELSLPRAPRNHIFFDRIPYVRPLLSIMDEYHHICAFLLERQTARWYNIFMGEISLLETLASDVPSRVKEGGWQGYESKRIERHIDAHLHDHFKKAAQKTFDLFKRDRFDWLFLGLKEEYRSDIEPLLHPYLRERLKGWIKTNSNDSEDKILKQSIEIEIKLKQEEEKALVHSLITELEKGGRAVSGVREVLRKLNAAEVQTLVVTRHFSGEGRACPKCRFLYADELQCPVCNIKTEKVQDIIHESVHRALDKNCQVRYVTPPTRLDRFGKIGAFLRY
jgi:peptide subunit release factor 1 (eRF1)